MNLLQGKEPMLLTRSSRKQSDEPGTIAKDGGGRSRWMNLAKTLPMGRQR
jgi:hypothetical protein